MITFVVDLLRDIHAKNVEKLPLEIYTTSGQRLYIQDTYVEDNIYCIDVRTSDE